MNANEGVNLFKFASVGSSLRTKFLCTTFWTAVKTVLEGLDIQDLRRLELAPTLLALYVPADLPPAVAVDTYSY